MARKKQQGKHRLQGRPRRVIEMVDVSLEAHFLSDAAAVAGRRGGGHYIALCGVEVLPAALVAAPEGYCRTCAAATVPTQRTSGAPTR
ncbi:MAG: hypothetical protein ACREX8_00350 [Gammaproteobacteria bacterium]